VQFSSSTPNPYSPFNSPFNEIQPGSSRSVESAPFGSRLSQSNDDNSSGQNQIRNTTSGFPFSYLSILNIC
jgi:hypothetical protein